MKTPGIIDGIIVAVLISLGVAITALLTSGFIAYPTLFNLVLCGSTLAYLIYLLKRSNARVGRIVVISGWALVTFVCWLFDVHLFEQVLIQASIVWLVRSLYFHSSMFTALLDLGLVSVGLAASAWAMINTGSLTASVWSFFLVQALFCWIPDLARRQSGDPRDAQYNRSSFQSAHRVAVDAVRKLSQSPNP